MAQNERFISIPAAIVEGDDVHFCNAKLNPFSIDFYFEAGVEYEDEEGEMRYIPTTRVRTRNGNELDVILSVEEFETQIFK